MTASAKGDAKKAEHEVGKGVGGLDAFKHWHDPHSGRFAAKGFVSPLMLHGLLNPQRDKRSKSALSAEFEKRAESDTKWLTNTSPTSIDRMATQVFGARPSDPRSREAWDAGRSHLEAWVGSHPKAAPLRDVHKDDPKAVGFTKDYLNYKHGLEADAAHLPPTTDGAARAKALNGFFQKHSTMLNGPMDTHVVNDELGVHGDEWTADRDAMHRDMIDGVLKEIEGHVPRDRKVAVMVGLPGAGKTSALRPGGAAGKLGIIPYEPGIGASMPDGATHVVVSSDLIKEMLISRGMDPAIDGLKPMEAVNLTHEESSYLAKQLLTVLTNRGYNVTLDGTMIHDRSIRRQLKELKQKGYDDVTGVMVEVTPGQSRQSAVDRYIKEADSKMGGRLVPPATWDGAVLPDQPESSVVVVNFDKLDSEGAFTRSVKVDNRGKFPTAPPEMEAVNVPDDTPKPDAPTVNGNPVTFPPARPSRLTQHEYPHEPGYSPNPPAAPKNEFPNEPTTPPSSMLAPKPHTKQVSKLAEGDVLDDGRVVASNTVIKPPKGSFIPAGGGRDPEKHEIKFTDGTTATHRFNSYVGMNGLGTPTVHGKPVTIPPARPSRLTTKPSEPYHPVLAGNLAPGDVLDDGRTVSSNTIIKKPKGPFIPNGGGVPEQRHTIGFTDGTSIDHNRSTYVHVKGEAEKPPKAVPTRHRPGLIHDGNGNLDIHSNPPAITKEKQAPANPLSPAANILVGKGWTPDEAQKVADSAQPGEVMRDPSTGIVYQKSAMFNQWQALPNHPDAWYSKHLEGNEFPERLGLTPPSVNGEPVTVPVAKSPSRLLTKRRSAGLASATRAMVASGMSPTEATKTLEAFNEGSSVTDPESGEVFVKKHGHWVHE